MLRRKEILTKYNRDNIIEAAERLFLKKGVKETKVDDVAAGAGISKGTLYAYFESKDEIYDEILLRSMNKLGEMLGAAIDSADGPEEKFRAVWVSLFNYARKYPLYFESITGKIDGSKPELFESGERINARIGALMKSGVGEGYLRADLKFPGIILTLWGAISGLLGMISAKKEYIERITGEGIEAFAEYGFKLLLETIKKRS
jgi:Transcriptional regulator